MQLLALVAKNLTLKRRNLLSTLCEILFPIVVAMALVLVRQLAVGPAAPTSEAAPVEISDRWMLQLQQPYGDCVIFSDGGDQNTIASFGIAPPSLGAEFVAHVSRVSYNPWHWPVKYLESEEELEAIVASPDYPIYQGVDSGLCGALIFSDDGATYSIRLNSTFNEGTGQDLYTNQGFTMLQQAVDDFLYFKKLGPLFDPTVTTQVYMGSNTRPWYILNPIPETRKNEDIFLTIAGIIIVNPLFFVFSLSVSRLVSLIVGERESKSREMMRMMGLRESMFYFSWLITYIIIYGLIALGVSLLLFLGKVFPNTDMGVLFLHFFLFGMGSAAFSLMMSVPFDSAKTATMAGTAAYFFLSFLIIVLKPKQSLESNIGLSFLPQVAFTLGIRTIVEAEIAQVGLTWASYTDQFGNYQMSWFTGMLAFDTVIYLFIYVYLDLVLPHTYGAKLAWNFWIPKHLLKCKDREETTLEDALDESDDVLKDGAVIEKYSVQEEATLATGTCVWIRNIRRYFNLDGGVVKAVDGVSMAMFKDEIFALLGHNGAGKSSLIAMLVGLYRPTSGRATILGYDVEKEIAKVRASMGFCPQHDILWEDLTVEEHLRLYGRLRGMNRAAIRQQMGEILNDVGLQKKINVLSKNLSGGMKRRLSIAIAFIGKGAFVILDEPTSGLDPYSRRAIWDLLKRKKESRVLCISTHYMDEAELLGDRVAILSLGRVKAYGSSLFLKSAFKCGYDLTFVKATEAVNDEPILASLRHRISEFIVTSQARSLELKVQVPFSSAVQFKPFFEGLNMDELGIRTFGITSTKLEDVFLKVAGEGDILKGLDIQGGVPVDDAPSWNVAPALGSVRAQSKAECMKRVRQAQRDGKAFSFTFLLPIVMIIAGLALGLVPFLTEKGAVYLATGDMGGKIPYAFDGPYQAHAETVVSAGEDLNFWSGGANLGFDKTLPTDQSALNEIYQCGQNWPSDNVICTAWYNFATAVNAEIAAGNSMGISQLGGFVVDRMMNENFAPRFIIFINGTQDTDAYGKVFNYINNAVMRWRYSEYNQDPNFADQIGDFRTKANNHPLPLTYVQKVREQYGPENNVITYVMIGMGFIMASIAMAVVKERFTGVKEQEFISGLRPVVYWASRYFIDLGMFFPTAALAVLAFLAFDVDKYLIDLDGLPPLAATLFAYGPPAITFTYWFTFLFRTAGVAQGVILGIHNVTGLILSIVSNVLRIPGIGESANNAERALRPLFRIFPSFNMCNSVYNILVSRGIVPRADVWDMEITGWDLIAQAIGFIAYASLTLIAEHLSQAAWLERLKARMKNRKVDKDEPEEYAVTLEKERVAGLTGADALFIIRDIKKSYGQVKAVRGVSVACGPGEVLGWLGLNGSGKSSSLKIAVGQVRPDSGKVFIQSHDVKTELTQARKYIGYCPQDNAIIDELSVMEHIELYSGIKGVTADGTAEAERWLETLDLKRFKNTRAGTLSGGNKRKLSVAIAMIGNPSVVFLDEPSAGMDPVARRFMWQAIKEISREKKRCVVITTHSMEEAEALSSRIAIMASGKFKCFGTVQELKTRYGQGFELLLRGRQVPPALITSLLNTWNLSGNAKLTKQECLQRTTGFEMNADVDSSLARFKLSRTSLFEKELNADAISANAFAEWWAQTNTTAEVLKFVANELPGSVELLENVGRVLKFAIRGDQVNMLDIFDVIETRKADVGIEEYSINSYSLEQIFNDFAKQDAVAVAASLEN